MKHRFDIRLWKKVALLVLLAGGVSCSSDEMDESASLPRESVKTQFSITIPYSQKYGRMTAANTQFNGSPFLGMHKMLILPFNTGGAGVLVTTETPFDTKMLPELESIGNDFAEGGANPNNPTMKAKLYKNVSIPTGTSAFLFYGEAAAENADPFVNGRLIRHDEVVGKAGDLWFDLQPVTTVTVDNITTQVPGANDLLRLLNGILEVPEWGPYKDLVGSSLYEIYWEFKKNNAGSARSVLAFLEDIYNLMAKIAADPGGKTRAEEEGKACARAVMAAITSDQVGLAKIQVTEQQPQGSNVYTLTFVDSQFNFPRNLNLPDGGVQVRYDDQTKAFVFASKDLPGGGIYMSEYDKFVYPPSLYYFINSSLAVSSSSKDEFSTSSQWTEFLKTYDGQGANAVVSGSTHSIAMVSPVEYAVGILESRVRLGTAVLQDAKGKAVTAPDFLLTGILVGGVKKAGWNFVPNTDKVFYTIYDREIPEGMTALKVNDFTPSNYTLVLPSVGVKNANGTTNVDGKIKVSLEFENRSADFYGYDAKLIPHGTRFYLVAELDMDNLAQRQERVFMSDHITVANFTIGQMALKNAYNAVPDLRSTKLELGMAVDLQWIDGLDFGEIGV